jgi:hypothetical protein
VPKKSSTAKQRARAAARNGAKYTTALRADNVQQPGDATARTTYVTISVAKQARAVGASSYVAETLRKQRAMIDSYVTRTIANMVNTSGVVEMLTRQEAAMGSMLAKAVANTVTGSGIVEKLAEQQAVFDSHVSRTLANFDRTTAVSSRAVAAVEQTIRAHERAAETAEAIDRAATRLGI